MKQSQVWGLFGSIALSTLLSTFCVSAGAQSPAMGEPPECIDNTPHVVQFVTVSPGVKLEVLDWGGPGNNPGSNGPYMVLLTGLGDNARVFDWFAFQFTPYFHVIGITRRGFPSIKPA